MEQSSVDSFKTRMVDANNEFVLLINSEGYYGSLDELKEEIAEHLASGGSIDDCFLGEYQRLEGVVIQAEREVYVPTNSVDEAHEGLEEEYEVHLRGVFHEGFLELAYAADCIEELLTTHPDLDLEDDIQLIRKATYGCSYSAMASTKVTISIPPQPIAPPLTQTGGIDWESKPNNYLLQELQKIQDILIKRGTIPASFNEDPLPDIVDFSN